MMRIACVRIPAFACWALRRHDPDLARIPLVVGGVPPERAHVECASAEAEAAGVHPGMTIAAAQALLPEARFRRRDRSLERHGQRVLEELLRTFTPGLEVPGESAIADCAVFFLDTRGLGRLHATEEAFARRVHAAVRACGYPASVGLAGTRVAAQIAALEANGGVKVVSAGRERAFLAPLPLARLPFDAQLLEQVSALGIHTIGEWAALPEETIAARFGGVGLSLRHLACGGDDRPFVATQPDSPLEVAIPLDDDPLADLEQLSFPLKRAVDTLARKLAARGLATARLRAVLALEDQRQELREAHFVRPSLSPRLLFDCLRLAIGRSPLPGRVRSLTLTALATQPARAEQILLFAHAQSADPEAVEQALARVRAILGPEGVVSPQRKDSHRPEAQVGWEPYPGLPHSEAVRPRGLRLPRVHAKAAPPPGPVWSERPTRLLQPPLTSEVRVMHDRPAFLASSTAVRGAVVAAEGPHRVEGDWWGSAYEREYYSLTLTGGGRYWVYHDLLDGAWYLQGVFD